MCFCCLTTMLAVGYQSCVLSFWKALVWDGFLVSKEEIGRVSFGILDKLYTIYTAC